MKTTNFWLSALMFAASSQAINAAEPVVTSQPAIVQTNSENLVLTYHSDLGNEELKNLPQGTKVYAHTGVTFSSDPTHQWQQAPTWGDNAAKYELTRTGDNTWTLDLGSIAAYYGLTTAQAADVDAMMFVFRTANNSLTGRDYGGADIKVPVYAPGYQAVFSSSLSGQVVNSSDKVTFTLATTAPSTLSIYLNSTSSTPLASKQSATALTAEYSFTATGTYDVIALAKPDDGGETVERRLTVVRPEPSKAADYPGGTPRMGAVANADGSVTFCLAAPGKQSVMICGDWTGYKLGTTGSMAYQDYEGNRYFWITVPGIADGKDHPYYYLVDGAYAVGDPYAHLVLDPYSDRYIPADVFPNMLAYPSEVPYGTMLAVYNSAADDYDWEIIEFKGVEPYQLSIYELLLRDFTGTEGAANGNGTLAQAMEKLDYLKTLGVNAVELLPIMEFNGNNSWGYNTNFYFAPDKAYGTPDDYRLFIDECHKRGMAVILDIVFNQSDGLHPWYQMYDIANNPFYNGSAPHAYSVLNDWKQDNPLVQKQWADCLQYWLTAYKVDGFRFDLVKGLGDNDSYGIAYNPTTNTFATPSDATTNRYNATRVARMKALHEAIKAVKPDAYFINENLAGAQEENEMAADGELNWENINGASVNFACGRSNDMNPFYAPLNDSRTWGSTVSYAESHDEQRMAYEQQQNGTAQVKGNTAMSMRLLGSVAAQMLMAPGAHMIWQFQEFGADENTKNAGGNNTDPKKVIWSYLDDPDHKHLHTTYRTLLTIRNENPALFGPDAEVRYNCGSAEWGSGRVIRLAADGKELYCVVNGRATMSRTITPGFTTDASAYTLVAASPETEPVLNGNAVTVPAGGFAIYGKDVRASVESIAGDEAGDDTPAEIYTIGGLRVATGANLAPGIYLVRRGEKVQKIAVGR